MSRRHAGAPRFACAAYVCLHTRLGAYVPTLYGIEAAWGPVTQPDVRQRGGRATDAVAGASVLRRACVRLEIDNWAVEPPACSAWGPRRIDLDLLVFGQQRVEARQLHVLPHPGIVQRNFVLYPLAEVAPHLLVPGRGRVAELASRVESAGIWRLTER